jgi:aminopeptidase N
MKFIIILSVFITSCALLTKKNPKTETQETKLKNTESPVELTNINYPYRATNPKNWQLMHTKLDVKFNFEKHHLLGKAELLLKPYFYSQDSLILDAKGFDIHKIDIQIIGEKSKPLFNYRYFDSLQIIIHFNDKIAAYKTLQIAIDYTAKPNELKVLGSNAITDAKGLYFIDPLDTDPEKPTQIWTQGETEASSCWFPTIDSPNQKSTQEILITVPSKFKTLSNGLLQYSTINGDGTRTDCWKQEKPHAPYLFMMAIGEFAIEKEKWKNIELQYLVEPEFKASAKKIFANTPQMLQFFSDKLGMDYMWDKYAQVVVRDYVSGAMENTSAVIFGEFVQKTERGLQVANNDAIVAHEMFHHWFGDYVTCESWSNLSLNESFATYGEYLWFEHQYGRQEADMHWFEDLENYLRESKSKKEPIIRFHYADKEDMFDNHSYAKGGLILHYLRKTIGDDAFFKSLHEYLKQNAFGTAEMHQLRLAAEKITGQDLNWFFNQHFYQAGHPELNLQFSVKEGGFIQLDLSQKQDSNFVFKLPFTLAFHAADTVYYSNITADKREQRLFFLFNKPIQWVSVDTAKAIPGIVKYQIPDTWMFNQFENSTSYADKIQALEKADTWSDSLKQMVYLKALNDQFHGIRSFALSRMPALSEMQDTIIKQMAWMANNDSHAGVRTTAMSTLADIDNGSYLQVYYKGLEDFAYDVVAEALYGLLLHQPQEALTKARTLSNEKSDAIALVVAEIIAKFGDENDFKILKNGIAYFSGFYRSNYYALINQYNETKSLGFQMLMYEFLENEIVKPMPWFAKIYIIQGLEKIKSKCNLAKEKIDKEKQDPKLTAVRKLEMESEEALIQLLNKNIADLYSQYLKTEKDPNIISIINEILEEKP